MREKTLKSLSGVMMAVTLPNMLPTPNSKSMMKYSTDHSWDNGIFLIASLYIMKARPGPSAAWNRKKKEKKDYCSSLAITINSLDLQS